MSDDEADPELLALLRQSLGLGPIASTAPPSTGVLRDAEFICDNAIDVAISPSGTKIAAETVWHLMQEKHFSTQAWKQHELHPKVKNEATLNFIFTMNLLNFSFWSELPPGERFTVEYRGKQWTGYWSLVAALQRALEEGHPITTPSFWTDTTRCPDSLIAHIFRSSTIEAIPLLSQRVSILREAGAILDEYFDRRPLTLIRSANQSAARLVNTLAAHFPNFQDLTSFRGKTVRLLKRAQILVADLWACFDGVSHGTFHDIDALTMFADYRIPQMLHSLGVILYSPRLESMVKRKVLLEPGSDEEVEIRGCSIWAVELLRRRILSEHPEAREASLSARDGEVDDGVHRGVTVDGNGNCNGDDEGSEWARIATVNAVLIDFFLYDTCKERERSDVEVESLPHHRTRSIFY